jgi:hypothetical protein
MKTIVGKRYRHYKGGEYTVIAVGHREEDPSKLSVVYRSEYDDPEYPIGTVWIRPLESFEEVISVKGEEVSRFTLLSP